MESTVKQIVKNRKGLKNLELIETTEKNIVLLRSKDYPEYAFLLESKERSSRWMLSLGKSKKTFGVKCVCDSYCLAKEAQPRIADTCDKHAIKVLFVESSGAWSWHEKVAAHEAGEFLEWDSERHGLIKETVFGNISLSWRCD